MRLCSKHAFVNVGSYDSASPSMLASAASTKFPAVNKAWCDFFQCPGLGAQVVVGLATSVTKYYGEGL